MKSNGFEFTEENKRAYIGLLDLCSKVCQGNSERKLCLEYGSSDYQYPVGFKPVKTQELGSFIKKDRHYDNRANN